ncbi:hypothetical protein [Plantactinospora sp. CA-290183]|uniref:hypothetical protein n=1 Tax=Plantactinospora sp. CA-290183 TaxID=3240006 RepID=UPI003D8DA515
MGVPANYFSVSATAAHPEVAVDFLLTTLASGPYLDELAERGEVPGVRDAESRLAGTPDAEFGTFVYRLATRAPSFTLVWDQALSPTVGAELNANLRRLFEGQISPEQFVAVMAGAR